MQLIVHVLWGSHFAVDLGKDFVREKTEDLVMKGALELVVEVCSLKCLPPVHPWQPHPLLFFLGPGNFQASCLPSYSHETARMTVAAYMKKILMEARIQGIPAALGILNWYLHLMANPVGMGPKGIVQGEASQDKLENVETETTGAKESGKGNIHN